jgi:hypothetical protein
MFEGFGINQNLDAIPRLGIVQNILKNLITPFLQEKTKEKLKVMYEKSTFSLIY